MNPALCPSGSLATWSSWKVFFRPIVFHPHRRFGTFFERRAHATGRGCELEAESWYRKANERERESRDPRSLVVPHTLACVAKMIRQELINRNKICILLFIVGPVSAVRSRMLLVKICPTWKSMIIPTFYTPQNSFWYYHLELFFTSMPSNVNLRAI